MAKRRKVGNLLALAVLATLTERPMHPYELASILKSRGKERDMRINWGSLYTVVGNLEKHGFIEATGTSRQGRRPERTVYAVTDAGRAEMADWLRELLGVPVWDHPRFEAALSIAGVLPPDEVTQLLEQRVRALEKELAAEEDGLRAATEVPRLFLVEVEYRIAMLRAETEWVRSLLAELTGGSMPGMDMWRAFHETGQVAPDIAALARKGSTET
jgi:DNA-binding PadR family transcriptional regulator